MCGIIGYLGSKINAKKIVEKLKLLEYRGYDSAGIYGRMNDKEFLLKSVGNINCLNKKLNNLQNLNSCILQSNNLLNLYLALCKILRSIAKNSGLPLFFYATVQISPYTFITKKDIFASFRIDLNSCVFWWYASLCSAWYYSLRS